MTAETESLQEAMKLAMTTEGAVEYFSKNITDDIIDAYPTGHAEMYRAILACHERTGISPVDHTNLRHWLTTNTMIPEAIGGETQLDDYLATIEATNPASVVSCASMVRFYANRIKQERLIEELHAADSKREDYTEHVEEITRQISTLNRSEVDPLKTVFDGNRIADNASQLWELPNFLPTQFKSLNAAIGYDEEKGGICKGAVSAILARSGFGKSTMARSIMLHWIANGKRVLYINYEESPDHWDRVLFTQLTKQNVYQSRHISVADRQRYTDIFQEKMRLWGDRFMVRHDMDTPYFEDMEAWVRDVADRKGAPDAIIIDTIQSMFLKGGKSLPRWGQYEEMMVRLEKLAKDLDTAVVITAQENSNRLKDNREMVVQSDAGGSLTIVQKSSVTIFITAAQGHDNIIDEPIMQLQIPKNRIVGVQPLDPPLVRYNDDTKSYEPFDVDLSPRTEESIDGLNSPTF